MELRGGRWGHDTSVGTIWTALRAKLKACPRATVGPLPGEPRNRKAVPFLPTPIQAPSEPPGSRKSHQVSRVGGPSDGATVLPNFPGTVAMRKRGRARRKDPCRVGTGRDAWEVQAAGS